MLPLEYQRFTYADEADILNVAMFKKTSKQWRDKNKGKKGNIREYATLQQLIVLSNLESLNAELIRIGIEKDQRLQSLNKVARKQLHSLLEINELNKTK